MKVTRVIACICLIVSYSALLGKTEEFDMTESAAYTFSYNNADASKTSVNNFFIRELAKYNLTGLHSTTYTYHYSINKSLRKSDPYTFELTTLLSGEKCTGDISYRDFDISDILKPEKVDFKVIVLDNGNYFHEEEFTDVGIDEKGNFKTVFKFESWDENKTFDFILSDVHFYSDDADRAAFFTRISYIDNYFASIAALNKMLDEMKHINFRLASVTDNFLKLTEYKRLGRKIENSDFTQKLDLERNDVGGFNKKLNQFNMELDNCSDRLNLVLTSSEFIELDQVIPKVAEAYVKEVSQFFMLSQNVTHSQQAFYYNLGKVNYTSSIINELQEGIFGILSKSKLCNDTDFVYDKLKLEIFDACLAEAEKLITDEQFYVAKGVLMNAEDFHSVAIGQNLPLELNILLSKSNYGIYNSYLHLIDRAIDIGNYELAENYIEKARVFQQDNSSTIISNTYIKQVSEELVKLYINKGFNELHLEEYKEAVYCFEKSGELCHDLGQYNYDYVLKHGLNEARNGYYRELVAQAGNNIENGMETEAMEQLKIARDLAQNHGSQIEVSPDFNRIQSELNYHVYLKDISEGKKQMAQGNYTLAYRKLLNALELEESSEFEIYEPLPDLFAKAATPYLVDQCMLAEVKVEKNELDQARSIYDRCFTLQREYGLMYEPSLQSSLALLNNNIFSKQCELANMEIDSIIGDFNNAVESGDFVSAMDILDKTSGVTKKNYYCEFDKTKIAVLEAKYQPAAKYQTLAQKAQQALQNNDHEQFVELYKEMEQLSDQYEVIRQRIEPMPLHYLFSVKKNLAFLEKSLNDYHNEEEFETALKILHVLQANNYSGKDTKNLQQKLAEKLAVADKATAESSDPRESVEKYTGGSSWYKHFKKAYIKSW